LEWGSSGDVVRRDVVVRVRNGVEERNEEQE